MLARSDPRTYLLVALVGYGEDHDRAFASFSGLAARNSRVKVVSFANETNPAAVAATLSRIVLDG